MSTETASDLIEVTAQNWRDLITAECAAPSEQWKARKMIAALEEHLRKFPNFKAERVAEMFLSATTKYRGWMVYQPVTKWTREVQKRNRFSSFAAAMD